MPIQRRHCQSASLDRQSPYSSFSSLDRQNSSSLFESYQPVRPEVLSSLRSPLRPPAPFHGVIHVSEVRPRPWLWIHRLHSEPAQVPTGVRSHDRNLKAPWLPATDRPPDSKSTRPRQPVPTSPSLGPIPRDRLPSASDAQIPQARLANARQPSRQLSPGPPRSEPPVPARRTLRSLIRAILPALCWCSSYPSPAHEIVPANHPSSAPPTQSTRAAVGFLWALASVVLGLALRPCRLIAAPAHGSPNHPPRSPTCWPKGPHRHTNPPTWP